MSVFYLFLFREKNIFEKFPINLRMKCALYTNEQIKINQSIWNDCSIYVLRLIYFHFCNFLHNEQFCASIHKFCNLLHNLRSCAPILYILQFRCRIFKILQNCLPRGAILQYSLYWKLSARCRIHGKTITIIHWIGNKSEIFWRFLEKNYLLTHFWILTFTII